MQPWQIIVICVAAALGAALFLIKPAIEGRLEAEIENSKAWIKDNLGYCVYLVGKQGSGKTTLACGLVNFIQDDLIALAKSSIKNFTTVFFDLDCHRANKIIDDFFNKGIWDSDLIAKAILAVDQYAVIGDTTYNNYLKNAPGKQLLVNYIEAYLALLRNNYVYYANGKFFSFINGKWAMPYTADMINIKDRAESKDYSIFRYAVIFDDEQETNTAKAESHFTYAAADRGADLFFSLIRHLGKGTIYYITTNQKFIGHNQKMERDLATSICFVLKMKTVNPFWFSNFICKLVKMFIEDLFILKNEYLNRDDLERFYYASKLKKLYFKVNQRLKLNYSNSYLRYHILKYNSADDVGKRPQNTIFEADETTLTFPLKYCFGSVDRYQYSSLQDYLTGLSRNYAQYAQKKVDDVDYCKEILKKAEKPKPGKGKQKEPKSEN
jgi:hypothetical protein